MAGKVRNLSPWLGPTRIKGVAHTYYSPFYQRWILRSWPKGQGADSPARALGRATFTAVVKAIKSVCPEDREAVVELAANTPYLDRDLLYKAATGTLLEFTDDQGRRWMSTRNAIQNIQPMLDSISPAPGSMLFRGPNFWASIDAPIQDAVMFWDDTNKIAWWAHYDEALNALLESLGAGEGAVLYRNATGWTFLPPGTSGDVLTTQGSGDIPIWAPNSGGSGGVTYGAGVPTGLETQGRLYSRTDAAEVYSSQPISAGGTVTQAHDEIDGLIVPGAITLSSAPTAGNLLVVICGFSNGTAAPPTFNTTDWSHIGSITNGASGGAIGGFVMARIVQPGDGATLPALCTAGGDWTAIGCWEISNTATGTLADLSVSVMGGGYGNNVATGNLTTDQAGQLILLGAAMYDGSTNITVMGSGWTLDAAANNNGNYGALSMWHKNAGALGDVLNETTIGNAGGSHYQANMMVGVKVTTTTTANWVKVSV